MAVTKSDLLADAEAELETRIRCGHLRTAEDLRADFPAVWDDPEARLELVYSEYVFRTGNGEQPRREDWFDRYPDLHERLERLFGLYDLMAGDTHRPAATVGPERPLAKPPANDEHPDGYEILGELGRGGMAVVYRARHQELNRVVALKVLRWGDWDAAADARRVRREAELVARLQHPNIVLVYEVGEWDGDPFLALEYVSGGTLAEALARLQKQGHTGVSTMEAAALVGLLAGAVQAAHDQGVVHRDLKPANVLLADDPAGPFARPKVTDFGLAVSSELPSSLTQTATLAGTPCYMAPEQADARRAAVGPRTDVYALGGLLYELLTGRPPFQGATVLETLDLVRHAEPVSPRLLRPNLPHDLETICLKCLSKEPARRYDSAAALADDLARFRDGRPITARPVGVVEKGWKWCRRKPVLAGLAAALVLAVTLGVAGITREYRRAEDERANAVAKRVEAEENLARSERMLGHSRQSLIEMVNMGVQLACQEHSAEAGRRILEVARTHQKRMFVEDDDLELRRLAVRVCTRLADAYIVIAEDTNRERLARGHACLVEALELAEQLGPELKLTPEGHRELIRLAAYQNNLAVNAGGPADRRAWILDRAESLLGDYLAAPPPDAASEESDVSTWHASLWMQRAGLASTAGDVDGELTAYEQAARVAADLHPDRRRPLNFSAVVIANGRLSAARRAAGRAGAVEAAEAALQAARGFPNTPDPTQGKLMALNEAMAARMTAELDRTPPRDLPAMLDELAPHRKAFRLFLDGKTLPRFAGYVAVLHKSVAASAAALKHLGRQDEATAALAEVVGVRLSGEWKSLPHPAVLANHADLIERLLATGRPAEARKVAESATPLLMDRPNTGLLARQALDRLRKAIAAVPPM